MAPNEVLVLDDLNMELTGQSSPRFKTSFQEWPFEPRMVLLSHPAVHVMCKRSCWQSGLIWTRTDGTHQGLGFGRTE